MMSVVSHRRQSSKMRRAMKIIKKCADKKKEDDLLSLLMDGEEALHDVIHIVCNFVHGRDLNHMARVCLSWRYAVWLEKCKRYYTQTTKLPFKMDNLEEKLLHVNPCVSVIIYTADIRENNLLLPLIKDWRSEYPNEDQEESLPVSNEHPPNKTIGLRVDEFFNTWDSKFVLHCGLFGLFFPNQEQHFRVRASCIQMHSGELEVPPGHYTTSDFQAIDRSVTQQLVDELGLDDCPHPNSTILFLGHSGKHRVLDLTLRNCIYKVCERAQDNGKKITLGSLFGTKVVKAEENCRGVRCPQSWQLGVVLHISGATLESWSTFIYHYAPISEIVRKLRELKARIKRKRHCLGLISSTRCDMRGCIHSKHPCGDSYGMMVTVKDMFPDVPFVASFACCTYWQRPNINLNPILSHENDFPRDFCVDRYLSILIMSHD